MNKIRMTPHGMVRHVMTIEDEATGMIEIVLEMVE
jgi:hypothetical protein